MSGLPPSPERLTLGERVLKAFDSDGALASTIDAFETRSGQRNMAAAVADIFESGGALLAEAGTGTGKTLAYLIPAILSGRRVLVSTGTKNLQEQLYFKDLPLLHEALNIPFKATYMKGRNNYLCLHRFEAECDNPMPRPTTDHAYLTILKEWAHQTEIGDRAELEDLPDDLPLWSEVSATQENCLGTECPKYNDCFVTQMRQRAIESDIVIVNHHLLCADAAVRQGGYGEVIPDYSFAVVDEAHQLEDVATQYFGISVSTFRVENLILDGFRLMEAGLPLDPVPADTVRAALEQVRDGAHAFFTAVLTKTRDSKSESVGVRSRIDAAWFEPVADLGRALLDALSSLESELGLLTDPPEDFRALEHRVHEVHNNLRFTLQASDPAYVFFLEIRNRGVFLRASPIDVSTMVRDSIWERLDGNILTSATLAVDGNFDYIRTRLGVGPAYELRSPSE
ncbi:MAG: ATP-dependent DNA helicase, partial [Acidobacteriota bacterium]|nr:ATP-dependent DNA helicase [Acidobacteriota bacterium]